jgi:hypothetical protein
MGKSETEYMNDTYMEIRVTDRYLRARKKDPKLFCTDKIHPITVKTAFPGIKLILCKEKKLVEEKGLKSTPMDVQGVIFDRTIYELIQGKIRRK